MEQTWRWFGENDPVSLHSIRQAGATGVVSALHDLPPGEHWTSDLVERRRDRVAAAGLRWRVCESIPVHDEIKYRGAGYSRLVDAWKDSLAAVGRAGIDVVCYNFMPVVDWTRTDLACMLPSTATALRFDIVDFILYDVFLLRRHLAELDYDPALVQRAAERFRVSDDAKHDRLEQTIIAGLPGGAVAQSRSGIQEKIACFASLGHEAVRDNLRDFLRQVVPIAEEVGVRLAIHPDDPPLPLFGLPRVVSVPGDIRGLLQAAPSPCNGITLCAGSYGSRPDNNVLEIAREFCHNIHFAHLRDVQLDSDGSFHESGHLDGRTDMVALVELLLREERAAQAEGRRPMIPMRPDHGHLFDLDAVRSVNPGYSFIGRLKGLAELRGVMLAVQSQLDKEVAR